jgi:DNA polymerase-1
MNQLDQELDEQGYRKQYEDTMRLYPVLSAMMIRGVRVDTEKLAEAQKDVEEEVGNLQEKLDSMIGFHLNVRSHQQCQNYFYTYKGIRPFTNKGKVTTDEKAMARLAKGTATRKPMPEASLVIQIRRLKKLLSTYFSITLDHDNRFRCSYNPRGTTTGRLSSSETIFGTGMNMQNIPPAFRQFIVPDPGCILLEVDKRQAEWVVTAFLANDARMMEVHEKGLDAHARTAELITGVPLELVKREHDLLKHETDTYEIQRKRSELIPEIEKVAAFLPRAMTCRQAGKKSNHGLNYGMQAEKFALTNEIPLADAEKIVRGYHLAYPGIANNYYTFVEQRLSKDRTLTNLFGHKRRFLQPYSNQLLNSAYDYMPQSTVGWVVNYGMIDVYHSPEESLKDAEILINSHDSLILQLPLALQASGLSQAIEEICKCLDPELTYHGRTFRLGTDFKLGYNWRDMKEASREENSPAKIQELLDALE